MPIYEYVCNACGHSLEALQKLSDPLLVTCPACHADALVKKVSAAGFQLKGSGWYVTDFRSKGGAPSKPDATKGDSPAKDAGGKEAGSSGDGKSSGDAAGGSAPASTAGSASGDAGASRSASSTSPAASTSATGSSTGSTPGKA